MDASRGVEVVGEDVQPAVSQVGGSESESDTISEEASVGEAEFSETVVESPIAFERGRGFAEVFASLVSVDLKSIFTDRAHVMRSIPFIMGGAFRCALRTALEEVISGIERHCDIRVIRGWKLFLLLPRLLL